jgi:hypothetical protein
VYVGTTIGVGLMGVVEVFLYFAFREHGFVGEWLI